MTTKPIVLSAINPVVNFVHGDGKPADTRQLCVRLHGSTLCVQRGARLLPVTVKGSALVECNLAAKPLAEGLGRGDAQAIAPVVNRERLAAYGGVKPAAAPETTRKGRGKAKAEPKPDMAAVVTEALKGMDADARIAFLAACMKAAE